MSDNVTNLNGDLRTKLMQARERGDSGAGGGGPHDPHIEARIAALETDATNNKITLARIEAKLDALSTKADVVKVEGVANMLDTKLVAVDARVGRVEANVAGALVTAIGKAIGPVQFVAVLASSIAVLAAAATGFMWIVRQPWFPR